MSYPPTAPPPYYEAQQHQGVPPQPQHVYPGYPVQVGQQYAQAASVQYVSQTGGVPQVYVQQQPQSYVQLQSMPGQPPMMGGQPVVTTFIQPLGPTSNYMICPNCQAEIKTRVTKSPKLIAYVSSAIIALVGCWLGCCLIPFCIDECMNTNHNCPNCKGYIGRQE